MRLSPSRSLSVLFTFGAFLFCRLFSGRVLFRPDKYHHIGGINLKIRADFLYKFTHGGARIYLALVKQPVLQSAQIHHLNAQQTAGLGYAHAVAACMAAMRKESNASVAVCIKDPVQKQKYTAIAEPDGRLRGRADEAETGVIANGIVLEVTQKLSVRGDYTSVVCGTNIEDSVCQYFSTSQQTTARCHLACTQDTYLCLIVEQFPITDPEHEQYRNSAQEEWEFLEPLRQQPITDGTVIEPLDKYTEVQLVPLKFGCTCTRRSLGRALSALSQQERQNIADENGFAAVTCKYCGKQYRVPVLE